MNPAKIDGTTPHPDEDTMEVSPFVELLLARMASHPKEFYMRNPTNPNLPNAAITNTGALVEQTKGLWNRKEKRLYNKALRDLRMQEAYERLVTQLLK